MIDRLLKPHEVAEALGVSRSLVFQLVRLGSIPSVRFCRSVRVRSVDLEQFIQKNITGQETKKNAPAKELRKPRQ